MSQNNDKNSRIKEENTIKVVIIFYRLEKLKKETKDTTIKDMKKLDYKKTEESKDRILRNIWNVSSIGEEIKAIKDIILGVIRVLFEN